VAEIFDVMFALYVKTFITFYIVIDNPSKMDCVEFSLW